eukprot:8063780-Pyramimonas_sp.AAC.1
MQLGACALGWDLEPKRLRLSKNRPFSPRWHVGLGQRWCRKTVALTLGPNLSSSIADCSPGVLLPAA